jgi:hypothetical protein
MGVVSWERRFIFHACVPDKLQPVALGLFTPAPVIENSNTQQVVAIAKMF